MSRITVDLLRRRSEHNEGIISSLEEISLHQEELIKIEVIGTLCRKLKILYLQNNIIENIEDLTHMKDLEYLNLALNNISVIEGLQNCEFLNKLDLTVNFIDFDTLEQSIDHLVPITSLRELFMMGNPCQTNWSEFNDYVIARLPQLERIDGKEILRTDRIKALQKIKMLQTDLRQLAMEKREEKAREKKKQEEDYADDIIEVVEGKATDISHPSGVTIEEVKEDDDHTEYRRQQLDDEKVPYTPETRREMYYELAEQKKEEHRRKTENQPKERNYELEHEEALEKARTKKQQDGYVRQCNEGKFEFYIDEDEVPGSIVIEVALSKYLDTSLIDVDAHPNHVSIVIKNKLLRLRLPEECNSDAAKAERSKITGALRLTFPIADPKKVEIARRRKKRMDEEKAENDQRHKKSASGSKKKFGEEIAEASKAVKVKGIVRQMTTDEDEHCQMKAVLSKRGDGEFERVENPEDDLPPELM